MSWSLGSAATKDPDVPGLLSRFQASPDPAGLSGSGDAAEVEPLEDLYATKEAVAWRACTSAR